MQLSAIQSIKVCNAKLRLHFSFSHASHFNIINIDTYIEMFDLSTVIGHYYSYLFIKI